MRWHKEWPAAGASGALSRVSDILKLCICVLTRRYPSRPSMWAGIEPSGFSARITRESCVKPPSSNLVGEGEGALAPIGSYGEAPALADSHSQKVTKASLRS
jgi:hypothetical protein